MSDELDQFSPCPHCGGTNLKLVHFSSGIRCIDCGLETVLVPGVISGKKQERIAYLAMLWNRRVRCE